MIYDIINDLKETESEQETFDHKGVGYLYRKVKINRFPCEGVMTPIIYLPLFERDNQSALLRDLWPDLCLQNKDEVKLGCKHLKCQEIKEVMRSYTIFENAITNHHKEMTEPEPCTSKKRSTDQQPKASKKVRFEEEVEEDSESDFSSDDEDMVPLPQGWIQQFTTQIRKIPIKGCLYISGTEVDEDGAVIEICAQNLVISKNVTIIPCCFVGTNPAKDDLILADDLANNCSFFFDFPRSQVIYTGPARTLNGLVMHVRVNHIKACTSRPKLIQIVFNGWKNSTFPLRNDNENQFKQLAKIFLHATEVERPWWNSDLVKEDASQIVRMSDKLQNVITKKDDAKFITSFGEKSHWTEWLDKAEVTAKHITEQRNILDILKTLKHKLHVNKGFTFITPCDKEQCMHFFKQFYKCYSGQDMLTYETCFDDEYTFETDARYLGMMPLSFKSLPTYFGETVGQEKLYVLFKPYGLRRHALDCIVKNLSNCRYHVEQYFAESSLGEFMFNELYPNCLSRPYGIEWQQYLMSGPVIHAVINVDDVAQFREACLNARIDSKYIWTRNIIHCSADINEGTRNIDSLSKYKQILLETQKTN